MTTGLLFLSALALIYAVYVTVRIWRVRRMAIGGVAAVFPGVRERPATPGPRADDLSEQLERLNELHAAGALTDEEFRVAKRRLLGDGDEQT